MEQKETVTLTVNTVNSVLQYIGSKPYIEVAQLINQIQTEVQQLNKKEDLRLVMLSALQEVRFCGRFFRCLLMLKVGR